MRRLPGRSPSATASCGAGSTRCCAARGHAPETRTGADRRAGARPGRPRGVAGRGAPPPLQEGVRAPADARLRATRGSSRVRSCCAGVWGFQTVVPTRTLDSHASRLRKKLSRGESTFVVNVWGVGYRLVDTVAAAVSAVTTLAGWVAAGIAVTLLRGRAEDAGQANGGGGPGLPRAAGTTGGGATGAGGRRWCRRAPPRGACAPSTPSWGEPRWPWRTSPRGVGDRRRFGTSSALISVMSWPIRSRRGGRRRRRPA